MGKGSSILATLALVVGLGVGIFVIYDNFFVITPNIPPENEWYDIDTGINYVQSSYVWDTLSMINIDFSVSPGQSVYFLFIGKVNFDDASTPGGTVDIKLKVDGIIWYYPSVFVRRYNAVAPGGLTISVSLQNYNTTMAPGNHSIEVVYRGDYTTDYVFDASLFIQTFN